MSVFIIEHVYKTYQDNGVSTNVLRDININLPENGFVSIVGKSGSGKSTLLNILYGLEKPNKGRVFFGKNDISKLNDKAYSKYHLTGVSMIFQHYNLFSELTALENAIIPLIMKGYSVFKAKEKVSEYFSKLGIESLKDRVVKDLSGGEKQRVAIVRALSTNPKVILCDEPTGALDNKNSYEIMRILKEISDRILVVLVSHNRALVNQFSDQILVIKDGQIVENISNVKSHFSNKFSNEKIKYKGKWTKFFFKNHFKMNKKKNIFSVLACFVSFLTILISVGFTLGSSNSTKEAMLKNLSICYATVSESQFFEIQDSPLSYEKTIRPTFELIDQELGDFKTVRVEENLSYFFSTFSSCVLNKKQLNDYSLIPLLNESLDSFGKDLIHEGRPILDSYEEVLVNSEFASRYGVDKLNNTEIIISSNAPVKFKTNDESNPFIKDEFVFVKKFRVVGIVDEFSFLNSPKIYYSYDFAKRFLKNTIMENLSKYLNKPTSYFSYLENAKEDDVVCSYSYFLFLDGISEIDQFFNKVKSLQNDSNKLQIDSLAFSVNDTYTTFIESFSSALIFFVIIAFIGVNFILGMISLSSFIENKKETAIMTCLGARNGSIYKIYLTENTIVIIASLLLAFFFSPLATKMLNLILYKEFSLSNLISIPYKSFLGISFGLEIFLFLVSILFSYCFCLTPMIIYRHKSLSDELRDE